MALDPSIIAGLRPPQVQNPLEALSQLTQMQAQREQMEIRRLAAEEAREKRNRQARYEQALQRAVSIGPDGQPTIDFEKLLPDVDAGTLFEVKKTVDENAKRMADLRTSNLTAEDKTAEYLAGRGREVAAAKYHPDAYGLALTATRKAGVMTQAQVDQLLDEAKADPTAIQRHTDGAIARVTDAKATTAGSREDYLTRYAQSLGKPLVALTPTEMVTGITQFEAAARAPGQGTAVGSQEDYILRRFGPTPTPEQIRQGRQEYQATPGAAVGSQEDYIVRRFGPTPTPEQIRQGRQEYQQSEDAPNQTKLEQAYRTILVRAMSSRSGGIGLEDAKVQQANHLLALIDQSYDPKTGNYSIPKTQQAELALGLARLLSPGGQVGVQMMNEINQKTLKGDITGVLTYLTGTPVSASPQDLTQMFKDSIARQGQVAQENREGELAYLRGLVPTELDESRRQALEATTLNPLRQSRVIQHSQTGARALQVSIDGGKTWRAASGTAAAPAAPAKSAKPTSPVASGPGSDWTMVNGVLHYKGKPY